MRHYIAPMATSDDYTAWLARRADTTAAKGINGAALTDALFPHQRAMVDWALGRGRAAIFADTGLGKTIMQMEWARVVSEYSKGRVLVLAPLAVAHQTVAEAARFGIDAAYARDDERAHAITVTNYEMLKNFSPRDFHGIVLDESSILKSFTGATRNAIIEAFADTPMRLACTATPAPNDHTELGNHSEFLGIKSRVEMLAEYFAHDGGSTQDWRLKGHARDLFWRWVCGWGAVVCKPSDIGFSDDGFTLPPLIEETIDIAVDHLEERTEGLFADDAVSLAQQRALKRSTMNARVDAIASMVNASDRPAIVWCDLNDESSALAKAMPDAVEVVGSDKPEDKADKLLGFSSGKYRVIVTKATIAGFGMNWQHCNEMYFMGPSHSYETTYQAVRRCWRFGQKLPVTTRTCAAETEWPIVQNAKAKRDAADDMKTSMVAAMRDFNEINVAAAKREWNSYNPNTKAKVPSWLK